MLFLPSIIILISISLCTLIFSSFTSFKNFHQASRVLASFDTTVLASTNHISKKTNNFLAELQNSLLASLEAYQRGSFNKSLNRERIDLVKNYLSSIDPEQNQDLKNTIEFNLQNQDYQTELIHSDYINPQLDGIDNKYASSLISGEEGLNNLNLNELEASFINNDQIQISPELLSSLVGSQALSIIQQNHSLFGLELSNNGINLPMLANGIKISLVLKEN